jgi:heat-inducible transcriptional repressor
VVDTYLGTGAPVGSRTLSRLPGMNLSPASIRNVMQDLEEAGLLSHPHTSAGRVPTEIGLRLFVDGMMQAAEPSAEDRAAIETRLARGGGPIEDALAAATQALSGLSACAGIVLVPKREPVLRQLGFVQLSPTQALAVMVGAEGTVENRVLDRARSRGLVGRRCAAAGADRARPGQPHRPRGRRRPGAGPAAPRRAGGQGGDRPPAR